MLLNLHKKSWMEGLTLQDYSEHCKLNETIVKEMLELAKNYNKVRKSTPKDSCSQVSEVKWDAEMQDFVFYEMCFFPNLFLSFRL